MAARPRRGASGFEIVERERDPSGHGRGVEQHQRVVQLPLLDPGLLAAAGDVEHEAEQLPADLLDRRVAVGDAAATKDTFAKAAKVVELTIVNQRLVTNYLDTRGVVAEYDGNRYTLTLGSQGSHFIRDIIAGEVMKLPPDISSEVRNDFSIIGPRIIARMAGASGKSSLRNT